MGKQCGSSSRNKGDAAGNDTLGKKHKKGSKKDGANPSDIKAEIDHDVVQTEATAMSHSMAPQLDELNAIKSLLDGDETIEDQNEYFRRKLY